MSARANPYVGLVPFTESDAEWFFGRDQEIRLISANLRAARLTLLYGASGVGKSSVLLAGVLPRLHAIEVEHQPVGAGNGHGTLLADRPPIAVTVFREWRDPPLPRLATALRDAVANVCQDDTLAEWDGAEPFVDWLRMLTAHARTLLVVLDQFEEYFQYHPDETGPGTFGAEFPAIVNDRDLRVHFLMSLREDAWSRLDRFKGEIPELFSNYLRVDYLDQGAARDAIVKPLDHFNATADEPVMIEPALVDAIVRDVRTGRLALAEGQPVAPGTDAAPDAEDRVETPYLQLVMERLWAAGTASGGHALSLATLEDLGGAAAIVSSHLTDAMTALSIEDRATAADVFGYLVTPSKTKIAHRASDLAYWAKRPEEDVRRVLDDLASGDRRILRCVPPVGDDQPERYEIFHDVLADAILEWAGGNRAQRQRAAEREARRRARRRMVVRIVGGLAIVAAALTALAVVNAERHKNEAEQQLAEKQQHSRDLARLSQTALGSDSERALLLALAAYRASHTNQAKQALGEAFVAARARAVYGASASRPCPACAPRGRTRPAAVAIDDVGEFGFDPGFGDDGEGGNRASLSRDGSTLAVIRDGRVQLWNPADGAADAVTDVHGAVRVAFVGDGRRLVIVTRKGRTLVVDDAGEARPLAGRPGAISASASGRYVATVSNRTLRVQPLEASGPTRTVALPFFATGLSFSPADDGLIAITRFAGDPVLVRWRTTRRVPKPAGRPESVFDAPAACFTGAAPVFSADGRLLLGTGSSGRITGWNVPSLKRRFMLPQTPGCAAVIRVGGRGRRVLVASDKVATVYSGRSGIPITQLGGHTGRITDAAFSQNGALIATSDVEGSARVWNTQTGAQLFDLRGTGLGGQVAPLSYIAFSPDSRYVVTADEDGVARMWDASIESRHLGAWRRRVRGVGLSDDGRVLASLANGSIISVALAGGGRQRVGRTGHTAYTVFSPDATHVATVKLSRSGPALFWQEVGHGKPTRIPGRYGPVSMSEDGRDLLVWRGRGLRLWHDGTRGGLVRLTRGERRDDGFAELSKDGSRVLIVRSSGGARLVDIDGGNSVPLRRFSSSISSADFSPDGAEVVTAGDRGAEVWNATTGRSVAKLGPYTGSVNSAVYSRPDGSEIAALDSDGAIRVFNAATRNQISALPPQRGDLYGIAFNSPTKTAVVYAGGFAIRPCQGCRPPDQLEDHAGERLTLTPEQIEAFVEKESR